MYRRCRSSYNSVYGSADTLGLLAPILHIYTDRAMYCLNRSIVCYSSGTQDEEFVLFTGDMEGKKGKDMEYYYLIDKDIFIIQNPKIGALLLNNYFCLIGVFE